MPAIRNPTIRTNGTANAVSMPVLPASDVPDRNCTDNQPANTRHAAESTRIQAGERSRSVSSPVAVAFDADSVEINPPTTGFASFASVQIAEIAICLLYTSDAADERSSVDLG